MCELMMARHRFFSLFCVDVMQILDGKITLLLQDTRRLLQHSSTFARDWSLRMC